MEENNYLDLSDVNYVSSDSKKIAINKKPVKNPQKIERNGSSRLGKFLMMLIALIIGIISICFVAKGSFGIPAEAMIIQGASPDVSYGFNMAMEDQVAGNEFAEYDQEAYAYPQDIEYTDQRFEPNTENNTLLESKMMENIIAAYSPAYERVTEGIELSDLLEPSTRTKRDLNSLSQTAYPPIPIGSDEEYKRWLEEQYKVTVLKFNNVSDASKSIDRLAVVLGTMIEKSEKELCKSANLSYIDRHLVGIRHVDYNGFNGVSETIRYDLIIDNGEYTLTRFDEPSESSSFFLPADQSFLPQTDSERILFSTVNEKTGKKTNWALTDGNKSMLCYKYILPEQLNVVKGILRDALNVVKDAHESGYVISPDKDLIIFGRVNPETRFVVGGEVLDNGIFVKKESISQDSEFKEDTDWLLRTILTLHSFPIDKILQFAAKSNCMRTVEFNDTAVDKDVIDFFLVAGGFTSNPPKSLEDLLQHPLISGDSTQYEQFGKRIQGLAKGPNITEYTLMKPDCNSASDVVDGNLETISTKVSRKRSAGYDYNGFPLSVYPNTYSNNQATAQGYSYQAPYQVQQAPYQAQQLQQAQQVPYQAQQAPYQAQQLQQTQQAQQQSTGQPNNQESKCGGKISARCLDPKTNQYTEVSPTGTWNGSPIVMDPIMKNEPIVVPPITTYKVVPPIFPNSQPGLNPYSNPQPGLSPYSNPQPGLSPYSSPRPGLSPYSSPQPSFNPYSNPRPSFNPYSSPRPGLSPYSNPQPSFNQYSNPQPGLSPYSNPQPSFNQYSNPQPSFNPYSSPRPGLSPYSSQQSSFNPYSNPQPSFNPYSNPQTIMGNYQGNARYWPDHSKPHHTPLMTNFAPAYSNNQGNRMYGS